MAEEAVLEPLLVEASVVVDVAGAVAVGAGAGGCGGFQRTCPLVTTVAGPTMSLLRSIVKFSPPISANRCYENDKTTQTERQISERSNERSNTAQ